MTSVPSSSSAARPTIVVFDLGNVLLHWDRSLPYRSLIAEESEIVRFLETVVPLDWHRQLDGGRSWEEALQERIALFPEHEALIRAYRHRFVETIPHAIEGTVGILETLAGAGVPLYALTNFPAEVFDETRDRFAFFDHFRGIVVSGYEKMMKPDPAIFRLLAERYAIAPETAVFVDDVPDNVAAACDCGFHGLVFTSPEALAADFHRLGLPVPVGMVAR